MGVSKHLSSLASKLGARFEARVASYLGIIQPPMNHETARSRLSSSFSLTLPMTLAVHFPWRRLTT